MFESALSAGALLKPVTGELLPKLFLGAPLSFSRVSAVSSWPIPTTLLILTLSAPLLATQATTSSLGSQSKADASQT